MPEQPEPRELVTVFERWCSVGVARWFIDLKKELKE